ncbi:hypothetical protein HAX54_050069 [Datura stramonium]|uniref:Uncharacterized protein n=1 Tax=Datura stramonium TaxID=4076 RepID=A0ABS8RQU1_DATST|nr:hypothetical protein [Datura stramonium]
MEHAFLAWDATDLQSALQDLRSAVQQHILALRSSLLVLSEMNLSFAVGNKIWPTFCLSPWTICTPCIVIRGSRFHGGFPDIEHAFLAWDAADSRSAVQQHILALRSALLVLSTTNPQFLVGHLRSTVGHPHRI